MHLKSKTKEIRSRWTMFSSLQSPSPIFYFLFLHKIWESESRSKPLKIFIRSITAMGSDFSHWIITTLKIWAIKVIHQILFFGLCGPQTQDTNRLISLEGWTRLWGQISRLDTLWVLRYMQNNVSHWCNILSFLLVHSCFYFFFNIFGIVNHDPNHWNWF